MIPRPFEQVLADAREDAMVLRRRGHGHDAELIMKLCDDFAASLEDYLTWLKEPKARIQSGHSTAWLRARFTEWESQGHARWREIAWYGPYGRRVRVFSDGDRVIAQWYVAGAPQQESWPLTRENIKTARQWARGFADRRSGVTSARRPATRELWERYWEAESGPDSGSHRKHGKRDKRSSSSKRNPSAKTESCPKARTKTVTAPRSKRGDS